LALIVMEIELVCPEVGFILADFCLFHPLASESRVDLLDHLTTLLFLLPPLPAPLQAKVLEFGHLILSIHHLL
jgi:hypothetical protein